ncbi:Kinesin-like protein kif3b [Allomyces arbusculus]|nr:Kinesin-like protein kif3b [Allomyces arbusculus]
MSAEAIRVCLRCRPFNPKEAAAGYSRVVNFDSPASLTIANPKNPTDTKNFTFDAVFDEASEQVTVYDTTARAIVDAVLSGFNGTVFVYGQTGTGKTFSMQGLPDPPEMRGIIPQAFHHIFSHIARTPERQFLVRVSFLEIYNEEVRDLLASTSPQAVPAALDLKEHPDTGVYVKDLSSFIVRSVDDMDKYMAQGNKNRAVAATQMNATSSRSHSIFTITIESSAPGPAGPDSTHILAGKLHLVDLAGSERQAKTGAAGDRLKEAAKINLSLSALGNCISALVDGKSSHVPFRDSKLTRLLQDSLGGNAKTLMLATMSPASYNYDETLSTLRYANRAKNIKNKPTINEDPKDALLREYQLEIQRLQEMLKNKGQRAGGARSPRPTTKLATAAAAGPASGGASPTSATATPAPMTDGADSPTAPTTDNSLAALDPAMLQALQAQIEEDKRRLLASKDMAQDQKEQLVADLEARLGQLEAERAQREQLASQLAALESKLLVGGRNIFEHVSDQERELEDARLRALDEQRKQHDMQAQLDHMLEGNMALEDEYASLQEEVDVKTRKLQKLWARLDAAKRDVVDLENEWRAERLDLTAAVRELARELALKDAILDLFVPEPERRKLEARLVFDPDLDDWTWTAPDATTARPKSAENGTSMNERTVASAWRRRTMASATRRPMCAAAKAALANARPGEKPVRYTMDNVLDVPLWGAEIVHELLDGPTGGGGGSGRRRAGGQQAATASSSPRRRTGVGSTARSRPAGEVV